CREDFFEARRRRSSNYPDSCNGSGMRLHLPLAHRAASTVTPGGIHARQPMAAHKGEANMKRTGIRSAVISTWKNLAMRSGRSGALFSVYNYMFDPEQLRFLMDCVVATKNVPGACVEAGCAKGATTAFLRKWMH